MDTEGIVADDWRSPRPSRVVHNINTARKFDKFTDVTFVVGPDENTCTIKAHRVVVGTASDALSKLILGSDSNEKIRISDVSARGFKNLIRFLYDVDVKFSDLSTVQETQDVAEKFKVYKLKQATEIYLNQAAKREEHILETLRLAIELNVTTIQSKCLDVISTKYKDVLKSEELISAPLEVVTAVLSARPYHGEDCHFQKLLAVGKWKKKHEMDQTQLLRLLGYVDFKRVKMTDFDAFIDENEGILPIDDIEAFRKCTLSEEIGDAPEWHRSSERDLDGKSDNANTKETAEADILKRKFLQQKLKMKKAVDEEILYFDKMMADAVDITLKIHKTDIIETVEVIKDCFSSVLKGVVEVAVESFEDMIFYLEDERKQKTIRHQTEKKNQLMQKLKLLRYL